MTAAGVMTAGKGAAPSRIFVPVLIFAPCLLVYLVFFVWPQLSLLAVSAFDRGQVSAAHYIRFFSDEYYWELLGAVVRSFGWMVLFFRDGVVSNLLLALGLIDQPMQLMYTLTGVIIALAQVLLPLMVLTLHGVFKSIDPDLEHAAMSLGAPPWLALWLVTLRLARGGIIAGSLLVFSLAISAFATPALVGGARANVMATTIYEQTIELLDWPFASALSAILLVFVLVISLLYAKALDRRSAGEAAS